MPNIKPIIAIVVPCYDEEEVLPETAKRLSEKIQSLVSGQKISEKSKIVFVDDGSKDNTWSLIEKLHTDNSLVFGGIKLSGNRGHQNALLCGLLSVKKFVDAAISIDADLQDDIDVIDKMIEKYLLGCEIVYGVRSDRKSDTLFKRVTAQGFYRIIQSLGVNIVYNHADFRLMGSKALNALSEYSEVNIFLRGIVPMLGFKTGIELYARTKRTAGISKYPLKKMLTFSWEGITSFSIKPISIITGIGIVSFFISICMALYFIIRRLSSNAVTGWASIIVSIWALSGLIIFSIGIVGEYIGKIYLETKHRPHFHIEQFLFGENDEPC